jgi:integrase/recombinase XerC
LDEELISEFEGFIGATRRPRTAKSYGQGARKLLRYLEEAEITPENAPPGLMGNFVQWMVQEEKLEPASVKLFSIGANRFLDWRRNQGDEIPAFGKPDLPKVPEHVVEVLTPDQILLYVGLVSQNITEPSRTALLLLPFTGLRSGEMCELQLRHLGSAKDKNGKAHLLFDFPGKGAKRRRVPIADKGKKILRDYLEDWRDEYAFKDKGNAFLFPGRSEGHLSTRTMRDGFAFVRSKLGRGLITPHILRKTYCTELLRSGFKITTVAEVMGHSSINTTHKYYSHVYDQDVMEAGNLTYKESNG